MRWFHRNIWEFGRFLQIGGLIIFIQQEAIWLKSGANTGWISILAGVFIGCGIIMERYASEKMFGKQR